MTLCLSNPSAVYQAKCWKMGVVVASFADAEGRIETGYYPHAGKTYTLRLTVPDYGEVSAQTRIPQAPRATARYTEKRNGRWHSAYYHFNVSSVAVGDDVRAAWIMVNKQFDDQKPDRANEYYSRSGYADQLNGVRDDDDVAARGSNIGFEEYLRFPRKNIAAADDIQFSISGYDKGYKRVDYDYDDLPLDEQGWPIIPEREYIYLSCFYVQVIAPSDDYDKYHRDVYRQHLYNYDTGIPLLEETVYVYNMYRQRSGHICRVLRHNSSDRIR